MYIANVSTKARNKLLTILGIRITSAIALLNRLLYLAKAYKVFLSKKVFATIVTSLGR